MVVTAYGIEDIEVHNRNIHNKVDIPPRTLESLKYDNFGDETYCRYRYKDNRASLLLRYQKRFISVSHT